jgi:nucleoside-diphosphate-sugar epimerase
MTDYFNRVADALGLERPPQITLAQARTELSTGMQSYLAESKRLDNRRMREELGVAPRYPDLAQGLAACLAGERQENTG